MKDFALLIVIGAHGNDIPGDLKSLGRSAMAILLSPSLPS